jgi:DNA-directed RNA polymerase sigma subunit (sigma70/sigma32)
MNCGAILNEKELKAVRYLQKYREHDFFKKISERDKEIFEKRTGCLGSCPKTFNEISKEFKLTKQACQYTVVKVCKKIGKQVGVTESHMKNRFITEQA